MRGGAGPSFHFFALSVTVARLPAGRVRQSYGSPAPLRKGGVIPSDNHIHPLSRLEISIRTVKGK